LFSVNVYDNVRGGHSEKVIKYFNNFAL